MSNNSARIRASLQANPTAPARRIAKNLKLTVAEVRAVMGAETPVGVPVPPHPGGVPLSSKRVLARRPAESAAKFIKRLPKGRGFDPHELSHQWGMSEETIKKHARDLGCLKYVEVSDEEWSQLILNPETATEYAN